MALLRRLLKGTQDFVARVQRGPFGEGQRKLFEFKHPDDIRKWMAFSDEELGGKSTAELYLTTKPMGTAVLGGNLSRAVGEGADPRLKRSGYAGMYSFPPEEGTLDLEDFDSLVFRVYGDGRKYIANLRCENWLVDDRSKDVWQAFLFARKGEWSEVEIPLLRFLLTWHGKVVEEVVEVNSKRITSVGISLAGGDDQPQGPYRLGIDWIAARNSSMHSLDEEEEQRSGEEERQRHREARTLGLR